MVAAELDCKHAQKAAEDLLALERLRQFVGLEGTRDINAKVAKLQKIFDSCPRKSYSASGKSAGASFSGTICSLDKPFEITVVSITGTWPMRFTPNSERAGQMEGSFSSNGCTIAGGGPYTITLAEDGSGTIEFTYNSTATCPAGSRTTSVTTKLSFQPAPPCL